MFTFQSKIRYSECDADAYLTCEGLINYFQDCSVFQSDSLGIGLDYLKREHAGWLVNFWQIDVNRYPKEGESVVIGTNPYQLKGFMGLRNFFMKTQEGELLALANSVWTLADLKNKRPMHIPQKVYDGYVLGQPMEMDYLPRKIRIPKKEGAVCECLSVSRQMIDTNHHMNNEQFVRIAKSVLPENFQDKRENRILVQYKRQAMLGDVIVPVLYEEENGYLVSLNDEKGDSYAIAWFVFT